MMLSLRGGWYDANILMFSESGYQLYGEKGDDGQINYLTFEYAGPEKYDNTEYFKYSVSDGAYILAPTRNITKVTFPFDGYFFGQETNIGPLSELGFDSLYGFTSVPENKVLMKPRTDIGTDKNDKDYVDLGLTSGTLWATMNVGATSETDYGSYFQWGDTVDKRNDVCNWANYKYGDGSSFSKYNTGFKNTGGTIDNKTTLDLEDDAARVNMGGDWKMPSLALMEELAEETNSEWVTGYKGTNINGRKFTSKTDPSKYIFIPASGFRSGSSFSNQGSIGQVWITLLEISSIRLAHCLNFDSNSITATGWTATRCYGLTVRGVL